MIAYITGKIINKEANSVILENNGIGYEILIPLSTFYELPDYSENVSLYVYPYLREDTLTLFGFSSILEKRLFTMLISVAGIGPRLAINILSGIGPKELLSAISNEDTDRLRKIPGVGSKTAKRIVLELKEKISSVLPETKVDPAKTSIFEDAVSALVNLGYPVEEAKKVVKEASSDSNDVGLEELIKKSLRIIAKRL
jgi:Holliday junction DNA helicase RuvA